MAGLQSPWSPSEKKRRGRGPSLAVCYFLSCPAVDRWHHILSVTSAVWLGRQGSEPSTLPVPACVASGLTGEPHGRGVRAS